MTKPANEALERNARKLLDSKSKRQIERIVGRRNIKQKPRARRLLTATKKWQKWEEEMLGKEADSIVARKIGRTKKAVGAHRNGLGIASPNPPFWTKEELALLGTLPDREIARLTGHKVKTVYAKRLQAGYPPCDPARKPWTKEDKALLPKLTDSEMARQTGRSISAVRRGRIKFGIPAI